MANKDTLKLIEDLVIDVVENTQGLISADTIKGRLIDIVQSKGLCEVFQTGKKYYQNEIIVFTDDQFYKALSNTLAGETPTTHPAKWQVIGSVGSITAAVVAYVKHGYTTVEQALDAHEAKLTALIPDAPDGLVGRVLAMTLYTALQAATGDSHQCTDDQTPDGSIDDVYDAKIGDLSCKVDTVQTGIKTLTENDDSGTYDDLIIVQEKDPLEGQLGQGIYKVLDAIIRSVTPLTFDEHTYQLIHSVTGLSSVFSFHVDNPGTPVISGSQLTLPANASKYASGVPSLGAGDIINVEITIAGAVKKHYHPTKIGSIGSPYVVGVNLAPPVIPPNEDADVTLDDDITILAGVFVENLLILASGFNSKGIQGTQEDIQSDVYIDDVSNESNRKVSGSGQYPSLGYGAAFDSQISLKTVYTEELQLKNGKYQRPSGDYTGIQPTPGEDYDDGMGVGWRYVMPISSITLNNVSGLTIELTNSEGFANAETSDLRLYIKVDGITGWLDANKAFSLVGSPSNDGDACMVIFESTGNEKRISFGDTLRTGLLYIRVGLPDGDPKKFSSIIVKNIT